tara:strand:- start:466 stop:705 length:240 start_codon:yes stop_codon:yes gene_type:complete
MNKPKKRMQRKMTKEKKLTKKDMREILQVIKRDKRCNDLGISVKLHQILVQREHKDLTRALQRRNKGVVNKQQANKNNA